MASVYVIALLATLLVSLQPMTSTSTSLAPFLSPIVGNVCQEVECGKGKCKASLNSTLLYECDCDPGWIRTISGADDQYKFLPCVIPNCTMNYTCSEAPAPVQQKSTNNDSIFDICKWADCGGGSCNKLSTFTYSCECAAGYNNLLNVSGFPCYKECSIGMDCANLGISSTSQSSSPPPALADNSKNQAGSNLLGSYHLLILLMVALVMV